MPRAKTKPVHCDKDVKTIFKRLISHQSCTKIRKPEKFASLVTGETLNKWINDSISNTPGVTPSHVYPFNNNFEYYICSNLKLLLKKPISTKHITDHFNSIFCLPCAESTSPSDTIDNISSNIPSPSSEPSFHTPSYVSTQTPSISPSENNEIPHLPPSPSNNRTNIDVTTSVPVKVSTRKSSKDVFHEKVLSNFLRKPFGRVNMRERQNRMNDLAAQVLNYCVDRKQFREDGTNYMMNNRDLAIDVLNLIDGMKKVIERKTKIKFHDIEDVAMDPLEDDANGHIRTLDETKEDHKLAITLLGHTSKNKYTKIHKSLKDHHPIPSYHMITKDKRPPISEVKFSLSSSIDYSNIQETDFDSTQQSTSLRTSSISNEDEETMVILKGSKNNNIEGAKIDGGYRKYLDLPMKKHTVNGRSIDVSETVFVLDSFDGAEHLKTKNKISSVVSFSSSLTTSSWINNKKITAGNSRHILTWQQVMGTESLDMLMPSLSSYFQERLEVSEDSMFDNWFFYDLHDGKMLYLLTQHSLWNRKTKPFLLCSCSRGEGVENNLDHRCKIINHNDQVKYYQLSKDKFEQMETSTTTKYTLKQHLKWVDEENEGISHFGVHPDLMPRHNIRFDTFHLKCSVTRRLMNNLREFMMNQSTEIIETFNRTVLKCFWNVWHIHVWNNMKSFSKFTGNELALFVSNVSKVNEFISNNFIDVQETRDLMSGLSKWKDIFKFLGITIIDNEQQSYPDEINKFKADVIAFYDTGSRTFLTKNGTSTETFYMHVLRYYLPVIADDTFSRHNVGIGVFNMQGFERRNKESKRCMTLFSNNKGNRTINNMKRLFDKFDEEEDNDDM